ncbi:glycoside hydrolase family 5 protein [Eubacteriaceae bacterium ES3]|nr:glycoside hydrolase family 5 protein [Eubacteriaceae bacterium ES3]
MFKQTWFKLKTMCLFLAAILLLCCSCGIQSDQSQIVNENESVQENEFAKEIGNPEKSEGLSFVEKMGSGWNLGNSLDVAHTGLSGEDISGIETYWGNPVTTREMIRAVHEAGFSTLRVPVSWSEHMDASGNIDQAFLSRVKEVVDYGIDEGMYVIINVHHDDWLMPSIENKEIASSTLTIVWQQLAEFFKDYDDHLLFESMNEPRLIGTADEWTAGTESARQTVNELNAQFVKVIRESGGGNESRYLLLPGYCASFQRAALEAISLPDDEYLIVSVHAYIPYDFALNQEGRNTWSTGNPEDTNDIDELFENLKELFLEQEIPVVITEFGALDKDNLEARLVWLNYFKNKADQNNVELIWWDNGGNAEQNNFRILNRNNLSFDFPEIRDILVK